MSECLECLSILHEPQLIAFTKAWVHDDILNEEEFPTLYNILRKYREAGGGVVTLLMRKTLTYEPLPPIDDHESVWRKIFLKVTILIIGTMYRPPGSSVDVFQKLDDYIAHFSNKPGRIVLLGDLNLPGVDCESRIPGKVDGLHSD